MPRSRATDETRRARQRVHRKKRRPAAPVDPLVAKIAEARARGDEDERDAMVAMIVVRALERAKELASVEDSGLALRRALKAAEKPLAAYVGRHLARKSREVRKKA